MPMRKRNQKRTREFSPPVARLIGFRVEKTLKGHAVLSMRVRKQHEHSNGTAHGGILCSLSDSAMGFACMTVLPSSQMGTTVEFKIGFFKTVRLSDRLVATARILAHGRSLYFLECEIRNSKGELVAKAASTCKAVSLEKTGNEANELMLHQRW
jgi:uncharacterized protein (TIGR00369 family)